MLTPKEEKLLALALDQAAQPGEWATAGMKLIQSLRERSVDGFNPGLSAKMSGKVKEPEPKASDQWPGSIELTFGKHKGKKLSQVDPGYFSWFIENADSDRNRHLIAAMKWLLEDLKNQRRRGR